MAIENKSYDEFCEILNKKINLGELITIEENLENLGMKDKNWKKLENWKTFIQKEEEVELLKKVNY